MQNVKSVVERQQGQRGTAEAAEAEWALWKGVIAIQAIIRQECEQLIQGWMVCKLQC